jgi:ribulose-5-phosphate 4-epimerase/fuculose-1-phosphate aldolase
MVTLPQAHIERYIHSEIYKQYPGVNSVIHSHASAVVPYTISGTEFFSSFCPLENQN